MYNFSNEISQLEVSERKYNTQQLAKKVVLLVNKKKEVEQLTQDINELEETVNIDSARFLLERKIIRLADALQKAKVDLGTFNEFTR